MKTICIYHSRDLDGLMSGAIVKKAIKHHVLIDLNNGEEGGKMIANPDMLYMLGWDYGDEIPDLSAYDKVIMCDISFPSGIMLDLRKKLIWIDHHTSAIDSVVDYADEYAYIDKNTTIEECIVGIRDTKFAACELTWKYFFPNEEMPEIVRLLGRYDCFGHKGTEEEELVLLTQYTARAYLHNYMDCYKQLLDTSNKDMLHLNMKIKGESIYQYLCSEAKQIYKRAFPIELLEIIGYKEGRDSFKSKDRKFLCVNQSRFNPINFGIDYHKEGYDGFACFHYEKGNWMWSLYNDNGEVDCSQIAKQYGGGGHMGAAGFVQDELNLNF